MLEQKFVRCVVACSSRTLYMLIERILCFLCGTVVVIVVANECSSGFGALFVKECDWLLEY